ncbi:MAG: hypothetical protein U0U66_03845 [Cytophagaceae bacterium]
MKELRVYFYILIFVFLTCVVTTLLVILYPNSIEVKDSIGSVADWVIALFTLIGSILVGLTFYFQQEQIRQDRLSRFVDKL